MHRALTRVVDTTAEPSVNRLQNILDFNCAFSNPFRARWYAQILKDNVDIKSILEDKITVFDIKLSGKTEAKKVLEAISRFGFPPITEYIDVIVELNFPIGSKSEGVSFTLKRTENVPEQIVVCDAMGYAKSYQELFNKAFGTYGIITSKLAQLYLDLLDGPLSNWKNLLREHKTQTPCIVEMIVITQVAEDFRDLDAGPVTKRDMTKKAYQNLFGEFKPDDEGRVVYSRTPGAAKLFRGFLRDVVKNDKIADFRDFVENLVFPGQGGSGALRALVATEKDNVTFAKLVSDKEVAATTENINNKVSDGRRLESCVLVANIGDAADESSTCSMDSPYGREHWVKIGNTILPHLLAHQDDDTSQNGETEESITGTDDDC